MCLRSFLLIAAGWLLTTGLLERQTRPACIGVMPVYDANGESIGQEFTEQATIMLYQELMERSAQVTLLNPGGVYVPSDADLVSLLAGQSRCPTVLVTTLLPVERPLHGGHGDHFLVLSASLFDAASSNMGNLGDFRVKVKPEELYVETYHAHYWGTMGSRPFTKQPLGHHAHTLTAQVVEAVMRTPAAAKAEAPAASAASAAVCSGTFRVKFPRSGRISRSYDLLLDGAEESLTVNDGVAPLKIGPGEHLLLLHIADPPYKVPAQHQYALNFVQSCSQPNLAAVLDVGGGIALETN